MTDPRWIEVVALFERVLEQPVGKRDRFLNELTQTDPELRERVEALLRADSAEHPLLDVTSLRFGVVSTKRAPPLIDGTRIGPYVVVREIGRGGMSTVYLADDPKHRRSVALKLLHADTSSILGGDRFRREIEVLARLQHPHILPLYDSGESNGRLYYVMPFVSGETLRDRISRVGPLPLDEVRRLTADVGAALDYAHRQGVVHRDVKPANILVDDEHAMVADFGIAHRALDGEMELTAPGVVIGTPAYMSPEQAKASRALDARSDIYSLGCVVYELLTGGPPFRATSAHRMIGKHLEEPVPSARAARPSLPPPIDDVLSKAMAKDPGDRHASAREFVQALEAALDGAVSSSGTRIASVAITSAPARRWLWVGGTALLAVTLLVALLYG